MIRRVENGPHREVKLNYGICIVDWPSRTLTLALTMKALVKAEMRLCIYLSVLAWSFAWSILAIHYKRFPSRYPLSPHPSTMLDSSPVSLPRPLKRSASVASLPTPPRTHHKRKRGGSKHSRASDEDLTATDDDDDEKLIKEAEDEESFWLATNPASTTVKNAPPPLLYRRLQAQSQSQTQLHGVPPVSPPPSHRKPPLKATVVPRTPTLKSASTVSPPATPSRCNGASSISRDSPDNPFLASPLGAQDEVLVNDSDSVPSSQEEKPTMAFVLYVFLSSRPEVLVLTYPFSRGVRRSFPNPYYNASSTSPNPNSQLPPEHPDFEPEERGVRKLLFGVGRKNAAPKRSGNKNRRVGEGAGRGRQGRRPVPSASSANRTPGRSDEEAEETVMTPMKLNFAT
jgi:hypothetical protein